MNCSFIHNWLAVSFNNRLIDFGSDISVNLRSGIGINLRSDISVDFRSDVGIDLRCGISLDNGLFIGLDNGLFIGLDSGLFVSLDNWLLISIDNWFIVSLNDLRSGIGIDFGSVIGNWGRFDGNLFWSVFLFLIASVSDHGLFVSNRLFNFFSNFGDVLLKTLVKKGVVNFWGLSSVSGL